MILIYAPFPHPHLVRDGWMRRIATVERAFAGRERAYVFPGDPAWKADWRDYRLHTETVAPGATATWLDLRFSHHHRFLTDLVERATFVYAHTSHSSQHLLPYYATGKIVTDLHGIAPEEEALQGKPGRAAFYGGFEETMVRQSAVLVTVTQAMAEHFRGKYPGQCQPTIQLPIVEPPDQPVVTPRPHRSRPVVVYAGGLQRWQNVDRMLQLVAACRDRCEFRFYTDSTEALRERARAAGVADAMRIATVAPTELAAIYADADFGLVLRDDTAVNRVSCPTKLSEYLALGVVPIVTLAAIGDFAALGYRYATADDLLANRLPGPDAAEAMRQSNREVFDRLWRTFDRGLEQLRALQVAAPAPGAAAPSRLLTTLERTAFLPVRGAWLEVTRADGTHAIPLDDVVETRLDRTIELPGSGAIGDVRIRLGDPPFVTAPVAACLVTAQGSRIELSLAGAHTIDPYGNWCFHDRGSTLRARLHPPVPAAALHLRCEWLLLGIESLIAGALPPAARAAWRERICRFVGKVPGARAAWPYLRRMRGK